MSGGLRVQSGQAIGMLAGVQSAGEGDRGFTLIAGQGPIDVQAQSDELRLRAQGAVQLSSASTQATFAAAQSIVISTAEGASITITGGNITFACPGKITVHGAKKEFLGPEDHASSFTKHISGTLVPPLKTDIEFRYVSEWGAPLGGAQYLATLSDGSSRRGTLDENGYARIPGVKPGTAAKVEYLESPVAARSHVEIEVDEDLHDLLNWRAKQGEG